MRKTCLEIIYELAKTDDRIFFIGSDLSAGTLSKFRDEIPERFFMEGVAESHVVGMASGLAMEGKIVYVNTISTFLTRRCFEQIVLDVCLNNLKVRLIGNGGGLVYAPLGPTHLAVEDISIMRAIPNMTILAPADAKEISLLMPQTVDYPGPLYIRLAKGNDPIITKDDAAIEIGKASVLREGGDALLITTGTTSKMAIDAAHTLSLEGIQSTVLHIHTIKPLDKDAVLHYASKIPVIVSIEENTIVGGLGSAIAEIIAESSLPTKTAFTRLGIPDAFVDKYGSQSALLNYYGITSEKIAATVMEKMSKNQHQPLSFS